MSPRAAAVGTLDLEFGYRDPDTDDICLPNPKQLIAHYCEADWTFYGGAAGGGKSEWLVVSAIKDCLEFPKSNVAIFRRTHPELEQHIIGRFLELCAAFINAGLVRYNKQDGCAKFWNGSKLWFCHCQYEKDVYKYQSFQLRSLNIDEASHFTEFQVRYLITRVRKAQVAGRKRVRLASNPGNVGHGWLKRWFIKPVPQELGLRAALQPFEVWRPLSTDGRTPADRVPTRAFIPAYFSDNDALQRADPDYLANVYQLGGDKAKQLAEGDWDAADSMIVGGVWQDQRMVLETDVALINNYGLQPGQIIPWHVIPDANWRPPVGANIYGSVDYGYGAPWAFHLHSVLPGGHTRTFFEFYLTRKRDATQAKMIREVIERLMLPPSEGGCSMSRPEWIVLEPIMFGSRQEMGIAKSIAEVYDDELLRPLQITPLKGAGGRPARMSRPNRWLAALATAPDGLPWHSITAACPNAIRTVPEIPWDEEDPEVEDDRSENHCYEGMGRFFEARPHAPTLPPPDPYEDLDPVSRAHHKAMDARFGGGKPTRLHPTSFAR
jgi:hypothetical protein